MTTRVLPPANVQGQTMTVNGRTYTCAPGAYLDVPDADAYALGANGWFVAGRVGTTAERTTSLPDGARATAGVRFVDSTVGAMIVFDGQGWRNLVTGAVV